MKKLLGFGLVLMLVFGVIASQAISQTAWIKKDKDGTLYYDLGRVGIGLQNPAAGLHVKHPERTFFAEAISDQADKNKDAITGKAIGPGITNRGVFGSAQGGQLNIGVHGQSFGNTGKNYAIYGNNQALGGFAGFFKGGITYFEKNVGIGIGKTNPTEALDVNGTVKATAFVGDGSGLTNVGVRGQGVSLWTKTQIGNNIYFNAGNVGIKNPNPAYPLDVNGTARISGDIQMNNTSLKQVLAKLEQKVANLEADIVYLKTMVQQQAPRPGTPATFPPIPFSTTTTSTTTTTTNITPPPFGGPGGPVPQGMPDQGGQQEIEEVFEIRRMID
ncbi:MAG: hypothetical protein ABIH22_04695 [Candidatus Margulisiibacteriota bacterium]